MSDATVTLEQAIALSDALIFQHNGKHLSDLQTTIVQAVWQGKKYLEIAETYGCTEGHAKDMGAQLWSQLSQALNERVTKSNLRTVLTRHFANTALPIFVHPTLESVPEPLAPTLQFVGRQQVIAHLHHQFSQGQKVIVLQGEGGVGKTSVAHHYFQDSQQNGQVELVLELFIAKDPQHIVSAASIVEEWLARDLNETPGRELGISLARLKRQLQQRPIGILIDNLEPALSQTGTLLDSHGDYLELLRVLADPTIQSQTLITSRDRLCTPELTMTIYRLSGLSDCAWMQYFERSFPSAMAITPDTLVAIHQAFGGNAKAMTLISGIIREDYGGNAQLYWQENRHELLSNMSLKYLVASQFERLNTLDPNAYQLLCRLGCYRYQDIPRLSRSALEALLWQDNSSQCCLSIESLRNRSLIEFAQGHYWIHPVIKTEASVRLQSSPDWSATHRQAAHYWANQIETITTTDDALIVFEAFYHYQAIQDYAAASQIILKPLTNRWGQYLSLGSMLYRLGLYHPVLSAIQAILDHVSDPATLAELHNLLGDLYWTSGNVRAAIATQTQAATILFPAIQAAQPDPQQPQHLYTLKMLRIDSLLSRGLYQIDLWELATAKQHFEQVITLGKNTAQESWAEKATVCLALVNTHLGKFSEANPQAIAFARTLEHHQHDPQHIGRHAFFMQILGQTYVLLEKFDHAQTILQQAAQFALNSDYSQIYGRALNSLGILYRHKNALPLATHHHQKAIALLDQIGAQCDLAEAHLQYGLTLQKLAATSAAKEELKKAIAKFESIDAPKQLQRILRRLRSLGVDPDNLAKR